MSLSSPSQRYASVTTFSNARLADSHADRSSTVAARWQGSRMPSGAEHTMY